MVEGPMGGPRPFAEEKRVFVAVLLTKGTGELNELDVYTDFIDAMDRLDEWRDEFGVSGLEFDVIEKEVK